MIFSADLESLDLILLYIQKQGEIAGFSKHDLNQIQLASEEALVNIIRYAYPQKDIKKHIDIQCNLIENAFQIIIKDTGITFNPLTHEYLTNMHTPFEQIQIGGLGIFFLTEVMDNINYQRTKDYNILTLTKFISKY